MNVEEWFEKYKFNCNSFSNIPRLVQLKKSQKLKISLCLPTLNEEDSVGKVIGVLKSKLYDKYHLVDEIVVIDSGSTDKTKEVVESKGVKFCYASDILKKHGNIKGKGENLWKSLYVTTGDIIVWVDSDIKNIHPRFVYGLVGPLLTQKKIMYTKAFYKRPLKKGEVEVSLGGGRTTELCFRPLINMFFPRISGFIQPLSGEYAGRREVLEKVPFFTGYGVETGLLIDIKKKFGLRAMAQVDLLARIHKHQNLQNLSKQAFAILQVISKRANTLGKFILVNKVRQTIRIIDRQKQDGRVVYKLKQEKIEQIQRKPIITIPEYRKRFNKDPKWLRA